jgi:hypothetical protein
LVAEVMAGLEGCPCSVLEQEAGSVSPLRLVAEVMAGLEGCPCSVLEQEAAPEGGPYTMLEEVARQVSLPQLVT